MTLQEFEEKMLALPIARKVSGEDTEHKPGDAEYVPHIEPDRCRCDRCVIIRIKRHKAFLFPRSKCRECGKLFTSIYTICNDCRTK